MSAILGLHSLSSGAVVVAILLGIACGVTVLCLTGVRVWTARRAWRRAKNMLVSR